MRRRLTPRCERASIPRPERLCSGMGQFAVTERAAARIAEIAAHQGKAGAGALRVAVLAGGAAGFSTASSWTRKSQPDDLVIERAGARSWSIRRASICSRVGTGFHRRADGQPFRGEEPEREVGLRLRDELLRGLSRRLAARRGRAHMRAHAGPVDP